MKFCPIISYNKFCLNNTLYCYTDIYTIITTTSLINLQIYFGAIFILVIEFFFSIWWLCFLLLCYFVIWSSKPFKLLTNISSNAHKALFRLVTTHYTLFFILYFFLKYSICIIALYFTSLKLLKVPCNRIFHSTNICMFPTYYNTSSVIFAPTSMMWRITNVTLSKIFATW